jgi:hypothetical protein
METMDWFERLTGFREGGYDETRRQLEFDGCRLRSRVNGRSFGIGTHPDRALLRAGHNRLPAPRDRWHVHRRHGEHLPWLDRLRLAVLALLHLREGPMRALLIFAVMLAAAPALAQTSTTNCFKNGSATVCETRDQSGRTSSRTECWPQGTGQTCTTREYPNGDRPQR